MELRKVLKFNGTLGLTLPNKFSSVLGLQWKDYIEVYLADKDAIVIRRHKVVKRKDFYNGQVGN